MEASELSEIFSAFAQLATIASGSVVLTGILFPSLLLNVERPFSYAVFFISLTDLMASFGSTLGYPTHNGPKCTIQTILTFYFYPASWIWTTLLVYQLRYLIIFKALGISIRKMHFIAWTIPFIPLLLPLSYDNMSYGTDDAVAGLGSCGFHNPDHERAKYVWVLCLYWGMAFLSFILMAMWIWEVYRYLKVEAALEDSESSGVEQSLFRSYRWYPACMFFTWIPIILLVIIGLSFSYDDRPTLWLEQPCLILSTQNGTGLAIIYFISSKRARFHWTQLLCHGRFTKTFNKKDLTRNSADFVINPVVSISSINDLSTVDTNGPRGSADTINSNEYPGDDSDEEIMMNEGQGRTGNRDSSMASRNSTPNIVVIENPLNRDAQNILL